MAKFTQRTRVQNESLIITIPAPIVGKLDLKPGNYYEFTVKEV